MKRLFYMLGLCFSMILSLASCKSKETKDAFNVCTITDYEGEKEVSCNPKNVAMLYPSYGDIWLASGGTISIGVEDLITRGYAKEDITIVGNGTGKDINLEALVASKPDLTILSHEFPNHDTIAAALKSYGMDYVIYSFATFEDYLHILEDFAKINKNEECIETYGTSQQKKIADCIEASKAKAPQKVLLLRGTTSYFKALNSTNFVGGMINDLGCINIADSNKSLTSDLSMEVILKENPDCILVIPMGDEEVVFKNADELFTEELWQKLDAVQNNRIYKMEKDLFHYKPNIKWGDAYELISKRIFNEE